MSASKLPEALREALANVASAIDPISTTPRQVLIGVRSHLERAWPAVLAELAAQPEQAGGWEAVERAVERIFELAHERGGEDALSCRQCHEILGLADEALASLRRPVNSTTKPWPAVEVAVAEAIRSTTYPSSVDGRPRRFGRHHVEALVPAILAVLASPPAREAVERAVAEALPCVTPPGTAARKGLCANLHRPYCPARHRPAVLQALRSVELASAARGARLEAALRGILRAADKDVGIARLSADATAWECPVCESPGACAPACTRNAMLAALDCAEAALSSPAQPSELWAGLRTYIEELERDAGTWGHNHLPPDEVASDLRALLGLPPADPSPPKGQGPEGPQVPSEELRGGGE